MQSSLDWNDLRYFLAVAEQGSTLAAGRTLRVSQTTVARRIAALESALGVALFERRQAGYALTDTGSALVAHAEDVRRAAGTFATAADARSRDESGMVRITSEEIYAQGLIVPLLPLIHQRHPDIVIALDTSQDVRDLGAGDADIALRSSSVDQPVGLVGRRVCIDDWALYCSRDYADRNGVPSSPLALRRHAIVGGGGGNLWRHYRAWLQQLGLEDRVAMHHASSTGLLSAVRSGFGIAALPCAVAEADPELIRCMPPSADHARVLWLLTHERVRHEARVRAVIDLLYEQLARHVRTLDGVRTG